MSQDSSTAQHPASVDFTIQYHPNCIAELIVNASKDLVAQAKKRAIKVVGKERTLAGFRKGKAPDALVESNFPQEVEKASQEQLADLCLRESLKTAGIAPLNQETKISFHVKEQSLETGAKLSLKFEIEPKIPEVSVEGFTLQAVERPQVDEEKIQETIRQALFFFADWQDVTDRGAEEKDCVVLNLDVIETDPPKALFKATRFEITPKSMASWMREMVIGMKPGDTKEGMSVPDEEASIEEKEIFKPKKVRLTLLKIQKATLPELTDDFAKNLGVSSTAELKENITSLLNKQADDHVKEKEREQISQFLMEKYPFDLPLTLVDREARFRLRQLFQDPHFQSYWHTLNEEERKKSIDTLFEQSKKAIRMFYLCRKLLVDHKLSVMPQEVRKAPTTPVEVLLNPTGHHGNTPTTDVENAEAFSRIVLEKAEDFLLEEAKKRAAK